MPGHDLLGPAAQGSAELLELWGHVTVEEGVDEVGQVARGGLDGLVIDGATTIRVELTGGQQIEAKLAQRSPTTDLALLEFMPPHQLPVARLSGSSPAQGAMVVLVGHPFAFEGEPTLTWGLISASHRSIDFGSGDISVLQTSYPTADGASGSPVFDLNGPSAMNLGGVG